MQDRGGPGIFLIRGIPIPAKVRGGASSLLAVQPLPGSVGRLAGYPYRTGNSVIEVRTVRTREAKTGDREADKPAA